MHHLLGPKEGSLKNSMKGFLCAREREREIRFIDQTVCQRPTIGLVPRKERRNKTQ
jgi:hypothetical protein